MLLIFAFAYLVCARCDAAVGQAGGYVANKFIVLPRSLSFINDVVKFTEAYDFIMSCSVELIVKVVITILWQKRYTLIPEEKNWIDTDLTFKFIFFLHTLTLTNILLKFYFVIFSITQNGLSIRGKMLNFLSRTLW